MKTRCFFFILCLSVSSNGFAQSEKVKVVFEQGDVVVSSTGRTGDGVLDRSKEAYSEYVVGVFNEKTESRNIPSIIESGIALVKFDAANGSVQKGDYVTAASMPGYAMKAQQTGLMLGVAMEDSGSSGLLKIRVQPAWVKW